MDNIDKRRKKRETKNNTSNNVGIIILVPFLIGVISEWGFDFTGLNSLIGLILSIILGFYYRSNKEKFESFSDYICKKLGI